MLKSNNVNSAIEQPDGWSHPASQDRSIILRDELIEAGFRHLCNAELDSLNIRELASACDVSVGAFYKRFTNKQGFLQTLQQKIVDETMHEAELVFASSQIKNMTLREGIEGFVSLMINLFNGRGRGVIRASYKGLGKDVDTWEPMRSSSREIRKLLVAAIVPKLDHQDSIRAEEQVKFVYQVINGTLINELLNPWHVFTIENVKLQIELVELALSYLEHRSISEDL